MKHSSLPNVKGNLEITRSNLRYARHPPNVSRSCSPRGLRVRTEDRLTRSVGDRDQERRVFEWCKTNVNMAVRKLPKLDSTILTARGTDVEKFITFVEEAPIGEKVPRLKPYDPIKQRNTEEVSKSNYCQYCQREMSFNKHRRRSVSFTSPYNCEYCGASNNVDNNDDDDNISSSDSESCTTSVAQTVRDTIRHGNPEHVIDHRTFDERSEKSEKKTEDSDLTIDEEMDIFWRNDASEYFEHVDNADLVDEMSNLSMQGEQTVFLTEACVPTTNKRHAQVKMAWDNEDSTQFAEISRTIARDDGLHEQDIPRNEDAHSKTFGKNPSKPDMRSGVCLFQEHVPASDMKVRVDGRTQHGCHSRNNGATHGKIRTSNVENLKVTKNIHDTECNRSVSQLNISNENSIIRSPIANRSVGLSRVALMRLSRAQRSRSKSSHCSPGMRRKVTKTQEPLEYSSESHQSYPCFDSVDPEIKTFKKDEEEEEMPKQT